MNRFSMTLVIATFIAGIAHAQRNVIVAPSTDFTLLGIVHTDDAKSQAIAEAEVVVAGRSTRTDSLGRFIVTGIAAGSQNVSIRRVGYVELRTTLDFAGATTLKRAFLLSRTAPLLDTVIVKSAKPSSFMEPFEEHRAHGFGIYLTRDQLEKQRDRQLSQVLASVPGVYVVRMIAGDAAIATGRVPGGGGGGDEWDWRRGADPKRCYSQVLVDGVRVFAPERDRPLFNINTFRPGEIEGIEFYRSPVEAPAQYSALEGRCGTLLIWTRHGGPSK